MYTQSVNAGLNMLAIDLPIGVYALEGKNSQSSFTTKVIVE